MAGGGRKLLRWTRRIGLGVLGVVVVALGVALLVIHTDWGRDLVRARVERVLRDVLPGGAKIGKLEGSVFGTLTVRDIEIDAMTHRPLVKVGSVAVSVAIWPLVHKTVEVESLVVSDVQLDPAAGPVVPPTPPAPDSPPLAWTIELPQIALHRVAVDLGDPKLAVRELELAAAATIVGGNIAAYAWLDTAWGDKHVAATATVAIDGGGVRVPAAVVTLDAGGGRARVAVSDLHVDVARPRGALLVDAPAPVVGVWWPATAQLAALGAPLGDVVLRAELEDDTVKSATQIALTGRAGTAVIDATLHATLPGATGAMPAVHGAIALTGLDLPTLTRGTLHHVGALVVAIDASLDHAQAELAVLPALVARPEPAVHAALERAAKALASGALSGLDAIGGELAGPGARATPRVFASASVLRRGTAWSLVAARAAGTIAEASAAGQPVRGRLVFRVQALAPAEPAPLPANPPPFIVDADVEGDVELHGIGLADLSVAHTGAQFRGHISDRGGVHLSGELAAEGIANAGKPIGDVRLAIAHHTGQPIAIDLSVRPVSPAIAADASLRVALGDVIRVALPKLSLQLPDGKQFDGGGGVVTIGDRIALRGLALHHGDAAFEVSGQFDPAHGDFAAKVTATHIALDAIDPKLRGQAGTTIAVERRGGRWHADAQLDVAGFAAGKTMPPTDVGAHVALANDQLSVDAHASSPDTGAVELAIAATAPHDPTNVAAWRRLDARAIHTVKLNAHQLQIGALVERANNVDLDDDDTPAPAPAGESPADAAASDPIRGTIDGELDLAPASPGGKLTISGVGLPFGVLNGDVTLAPHDGQLAITLHASMPNVATAHVDAELGVPAHPFDPATWRDGGRSLLRSADATIDKVRINAKLLTTLGVAQKLAARGIVIPYRTSFAAEAKIGAAASDATITVDLTGIRGGVLAQSLAQHLALTADATGTRLRGELHGGGTTRTDDGNVQLGTLDATLAMPMAQWLATPRAALAAALTARWTLAETDALPVLAIVGRKDLRAGTLALDAEVHGTPLAPIVDRVDITAKQLMVAPLLGGHVPPTFDELGVHAQMADGAASVTLDGHEAGGGTLSGRVDVKLATTDVLGSVNGFLAAGQVDLAPIAALLPGRFSAAAGTLDGRIDIRGGKPAGNLQIAGGALPIAPVIGTLRDAVAKLQIDDKLHAHVTGQLGGGAIDVQLDGPLDLATAAATAKLTRVALLGSHRTEISSEITANLKLAGGQVTGELDVGRTQINVAQRAGVPLLDVDAPDDLLLPGGPQHTVLAAAPPVTTPAPGTTVAAGAPPAAAKPADAEAAAPPARAAVKLHVKLAHATLSAPDAVPLLPGVDVATVNATAHSDDGLDVTIDDDVAVSGRIEIDSGDVEFLGRRYLITPSTSEVAFDGGLDPLLMIEMSYAFPSMTLTAEVRGRVSAPEPQLSSDAAGYSDDQLFAFFLGGTPGGDSTTDTSAAVTAAVARAATGALGRQANKLLPAALKLDITACAPGTTTASGECTFGKQLSHRLYIYYNTRPSALLNENANEAQLQYRLTNTTLIDLTGGDRSYYSVDILSRHPW